MSQLISGKELVAELVKISSIKINTEEFFTYSSGIKSPIYADVRLVMSQPNLRARIAETMANKIITKYPEIDLISGVATGSIAMGSWVADKLEKPLIYWRKPKGYGHNKAVEGVFSSGQSVVVVEDVISTGGNSLKAVEDLRANDLDVKEVQVIYTHGLKASKENYAKHNIEYSPLATIQDILEFIQTSDNFTENQYQVVKKWREGL